MYQSIGMQVNDQNVILETYLLKNYAEIDGERKRPLVVICPGGSYGTLSQREGEPVAIRLNAMGFHAVVLSYHVAPARYPQALCELGSTVALIREHAEDWNVEEDQIFVMGFSAGGHLAASLGVAWKKRFLSDLTHKSSDQLKPNGLILCYPVITMKEFCHEESRDNLLGTDAEKALLNETSLEMQVNKDMPPVFLWHTFTDALVPAENSLLFSMALKEKGVPFELHIYPKGVHGLSLATKETTPIDKPQFTEACCAGWMDNACRWMREIAIDGL